MRRVCDIAIRPNEGDAGIPRRSELNDVAKGFAELLRRLPGRRFLVSIDHHQETAADALAAAHRIIEVPLPGSLNNPASGISYAKLRKTLHEGVLERGQTRHDRYDGITQSLGNLVRCSHDSSQEIGGLDDLLDDRKSLGVVALEQPLIATTVQDKVELPDQV